MRSLLSPPGFSRNGGAHVSVVLDIVGVFSPLVLVLNGSTIKEDWGEYGQRENPMGKTKLMNYAPIFFAIPPLPDSLATQFLAMTKLAKAIFSGLALAIVALASKTGSITHSPSELMNL